MKKLIFGGLLAVILSTATQEAKAQSVMPMGQGVITSTYYKGGLTAPIKHRLYTLGRIIFDCLAMKGAKDGIVRDYWDAGCGCYRPMYTFDSSKRLHVPIGEEIVDENGNMLTFTYTNIVFEY